MGQAPAKYSTCVIFFNSRLNLFMILLFHRQEDQGQGELSLPMSDWQNLGWNSGLTSETAPLAVTLREFVHSINEYLIRTNDMLALF